MTLKCLHEIKIHLSNRYCFPLLSALEVGTTLKNAVGQIYHSLNIFIHFDLEILLLEIWSKEIIYKNGKMHALKLYLQTV